MNNYSSSTVKDTVMKLMSIKGEAEGIPHDPKRDRYRLSYAAETSIHQDLNANRIIIDGKNIAIATQYPFKHQLEPQFQMMIDNCTPALVVLASRSDIQKNRLPEYFSSPESFGSIKTKSMPVKRVELGNRIEAYVFKMDVITEQKSLLRKRKQPST